MTDDPAGDAPPRIRPAAPDDLPAIERLLQASGLPLDGVRGALSGFVVAEGDDAIVGVAGLECCSGDALLRSVAVAGAWRRHGVGQALVARVIADAETRGAGALYLLTETAERYFPRFGFRRVGRDEVPPGVRATAEFRSACPESATVMVRVTADR